MQALEAVPKMEAPPLMIQPSRRPWRSRLARWGVMLVIFMAGGVAGYSVGTVRSIDFAAPDANALNKQSEFTAMLLAKLKADLSLTDAQYPEVEKIIVRHHQEFTNLRLQTQPLFEKLMTQLERDMQSVLNPTQWQRYKEQLDRMKSRFRRGPPGPGSPGRAGPRHESHRDRGPGGRDRPSHEDKGAPRDKKPSDGAAPGVPKDGPQAAKADVLKAAPAGETAPDSK